MLPGLHNADQAVSIYGSFAGKNMKNAEYSPLQQEAGPLIRQLEEAGIKAVCLEAGAGSPVPGDVDVVITEDPETGLHACRLGRYVIGLQREENPSYFSGADLVFSRIEDADAGTIVTAFRRKQGIPAAVAETKRLIIRESAASDFERLYHISQKISRTDHVRFSSNGPVGSLDLEKERFLAYIGASYDFFGFGLWTVQLKESGRIIGRCGLSPRADRYSPEGRIELGYLIDPDERRKGYGLEACRAIVRLAFGPLEIPDLYAEIDRSNIPSQKLAEKLGFRKISEKGDTQLWHRIRS